jgi:hypothetical protein
MVPAPHARPRGGVHRLLLLIPLTLAAVVYHPILRVYFFADDLSTLAMAASDTPIPFVLRPFGGHLYLTRNLVFLISYRLFGMHAELFYGTVLLTHLLNVWLLFRVLRRLTASDALACFGATVWGTSPLGVGTLGWYAVYGQVLVATIVLVILDRLTRLATLQASVPVRTAWLCYALLLVGNTCFGVGLGVSLAFPVVLFLVVPGAWRQPGLRAAYLGLPLVTLALYFGLRRLSFLLETPTVAEVLQEQIALTGLAAAPALLTHLMAFSAVGTTLGFFRPVEYPSIATWLALVVFGAGIGLVVVRGESAARRATVAMMVLAASAYLPIAVGRAGVAEMFRVTPAQMAATPRYHYVGSLPLTVLVCLILREVGRLPWLRTIPASFALTAGLFLWTVGFVRSGLTIDDHQPARDYVARTSRDIVAAAHARPPGSTVYIENLSAPLSVAPMGGRTFFPGPAGLFVLMEPDDRLDGRALRFIERDPNILAYHRTRPSSRLAHLLVAPGDVPRTP